MSKAVKVIAGAALAGFTGGLSLAAGGIAFAGFSASSFAGSLILGGISTALAKSPKQGSLNSLKNSSSTVSVRQPDLTRHVVYGHTRVTKGYAHMQSTGANGKLHIILILCDGPLRSINEVWMNDYPIPNDWIDSNGNVTQGRYAGKLVIRKHLGEDNQTADSLAVSNMPSWTNEHRLRGVAYLYLILTKDQDVYPTGVPNISAIVEGKSVYDPRVGENVWSTNIALYCNDYLRNAVYGFDVNEQDIDEANLAAQANICDEIVATENNPDAVMSSYVVDTSLNILSLGGNILKYQFGDRVRLTTTGTLPAGLSLGTDYYVIPYQIKGTPRIGFATTLQGAMNKEYVDITSTGTGNVTVTKTGEPRYHGSGIVDTETNLTDNMNNLVNSMAGRAVYIGGFWTLLAGAWRTPNLTLGIGDIRGNGISMKNSASMSESFNVVKGLFVSGVNQYQSSDYPSARYQQFIDDDYGIEQTREINLPFTNRATTAQRIAKIELFRGRQDIVYNSDFSLKAMELQPGDTVELDIERLGWDEKQFEVTEFTFDVADGNLVTRVSLRETAQAIFDWASGEAIGYDPAPNTNLPDPFLVMAPSGVKYNSRLADTQEGDVVYTLQMEWDLHPDAFVREFGFMEIQFKLSTEAEWLPSFDVKGNLTKADVMTASVNTFYDIRIRARNNLGVRSAWVTLYGVIVGYSGGVTDSQDWDYVYNTATEFNDYGAITDTPTTDIDWGYIN